MAMQRGFLSRPRVEYWLKQLLRGRPLRKCWESSEESKKWKGWLKPAVNQTESARPLRREKPQSRREKWWPRWEKRWLRCERRWLHCEKRWLRREKPRLCALRFQADRRAVRRSVWQ